MVRTAAVVAVSALLACALVGGVLAQVRRAAGAPRTAGLDFCLAVCGLWVVGWRWVVGMGCNRAQCCPAARWPREREGPILVLPRGRAVAVEKKNHDPSLCQNAFSPR